MAERQSIVPSWLSASIGLGLVVFVVARAAIVWPALGKYGVNPWIFLILDVVTIVPYQWGLTQMVGYMRRKVSLKTTFIGGCAAIIGFVLPYAYTYIAGYGAMPTSVKVIVILIVAFFVIVGPFRELRSGHRAR